MRGSKDRQGRNARLQLYIRSYTQSSGCHSIYMFDLCIHNIQYFNLLMDIDYVQLQVRTLITMRHRTLFRIVEHYNYIGISQLHSTMHNTLQLQVERFGKRA